jgi:nicotinate-nucleotide adenylyltransferase
LGDTIGDPQPLAAFGGTFDPVHLGHLRVAADTAAALRLPEVRLIPSQTPVHRSAPGATGAQRLAMLRLAVADWPGLTVDARELERDTPSYTVLTLESLWAEHPGTPILWLIGIDAFLALPTWRDWTRLFDLAHFVVLNRPGTPVAQALDARRAPWALPRLTQSADDLRKAPAGRIHLHTVAPQPISASAIRARIAAGASDDELRQLLPASVLAYIRSNRLYLA